MLDGLLINLMLKMYFSMAIFEVIYMKQPPSFSNPVYLDYVYLLYRSLYGLKQAPRAQFQCLSIHLIYLDFLNSCVDAFLFINYINDYTILLLFYMDDIILIGNSNALLALLISSMKQEFTIKALCILHYFLDIKALSTSNGLLLTLSRYIHDLLRKTHMDGA